MPEVDGHIACQQFFSGERKVNCVEGFQRGERLRISRANRAGHRAQGLMRGLPICDQPGGSPMATSIAIGVGINSDGNGASPQWRSMPFKREHGTGFRSLRRSSFTLRASALCAVAAMLGLRTGCLLHWVMGHRRQRYKTGLSPDTLHAAAAIRAGRILYLRWWRFNSRPHCSDVMQTVEYFPRRPNEHLMRSQDNEPRSGAVWQSHGLAGDGLEPDGCGVG